MHSFPWLDFFVFAVAATYTPGPNNIMSMNNAAKVGLRRCIPFNLGIFAGFSLAMIACMIFSKSLFTLIPKIALPMKIIGASYMLYLAYKNLKIKSADVKDNAISFGAGLALQLVNPKIFIYGIAAMSSYVLLPQYNFSVSALLAFSFLLAFIGCTGNVCWALFGSLFSRIFSKHGRLVGIVMAILLAYCAVSLFL